MQQDARLRDWCRAVEKARRAQSLTILAGSAISSFPPSRLPAGRQAASLIRCVLLEELASHQNGMGALDERIERLIEELPFETVMATLATVTSTQVAESLIQDLFSTDAFNAVHEILAGWMLGARAAKTAMDPPLVIITTNYDCGIENAYADMVARSSTAPRLLRVVEEGDEAARPRGSPVLFKLHGSVDCTARMVYTHEDEARLDRWQFRLLQRWVDGRALLILGYSGWDLDVFPAVAACQPRKVLTVRPMKRLEEDPHRFKSVVDKLCILGDENTDLREPLAYLADRKTSHHLHGDKEHENDESLEALRSTLSESLPAEDMVRWLGHLLVHTGASRVGLAVLASVERNRAAPSTLFVQAQADGYFYQGLYVSAARAMRRLLRRDDLAASLRRRVELRCSEAHFLNCAGASRGAWKAALRALAEFCRMLPSRQMSDIASAATGLVYTFVVCVPFLSITPVYPLAARALAWTLLQTRSIGPSMVLERSIIQRAHRAPVTPPALGQRAAEVNVYRYKARWYTRSYDLTGQERHAQQAENYWNRSIQWAEAIGDNPGLAKAYFGLTQLHMLQGADRCADAERTWAKAWQYGDRVQLCGWRKKAAYGFRARADRLADPGMRGLRLRMLRYLAGRAFDVL